ncbi:hypothetical protein [uncultured Pontibacter sp.]|uniref:leucine-rich repeat domain-containing protein n=1 Tax=uncultured Pontibacter sp. TaxID=453356 RepID=UPI00260FA217|nr:hypothetical protein [uncultured Pontibacter sp.]
MRKLTNSPLKVLGLISISLGLIIGIGTLGYLYVFGLFFIGLGLILFAIDFTVQKLVTNHKIVWINQIAFSLIYILFLCWSYLEWTEHNAIIFPNNYKGQAGIIFGIEGHPPLPETEFWVKEINIPDSGILITSTKVEDIPSTLRFYFQNGEVGTFEKVNWDPNFQYDCIINNSRLEGWLFTIDSLETDQVRNKATEICNLILSGKAKSAYKAEYSAVAKDNTGYYLHLQDKNLTSLPDKVSELEIYQAILTGNDFTEIPKQIFEIESLEWLMVGHNPIKEISKDIYKLKKLNTLYIGSTDITDIRLDFSKLDSLEHLDISDNNLVRLPEQIKNLPNLLWLSIDHNRFQDLNFVDKRLERLEMLDLYTNEIKSITKETKHLKNLKELQIFDNQIDSIPDNIIDLKSLEKLEIWNNPIRYISPNIRRLTKLKSIRLDDDYLTEKDKQNLKSWLPNCAIQFQTRSEKF